MKRNIAIAATGATAAALPSEKNDDANVMLPSLKSNDNNGTTCSSTIRTRSKLPTRLRSIILSPNVLQNILIVGILVLVIGILILYSRLMNIFESNHVGGGDLLRSGRVRRSSSTAILGQRHHISQQKLQQQQHVDHQRQKNNSNKRNKIDPTTPNINPKRSRGSERGHVECDDPDISHIVSYWNDPRSDFDRTFQSPFLTYPPSSSSGHDTTAINNNQQEERTRYLSFEPDCGGWNNIRMEFEIMVVLASATNRTLILPPDNPLYLLYRDKSNKHRGIQKFFQGFDDIVTIISTEDFVQKEMIRNKNYRLPLDETNRTRVLGSLKQCIWMKKSDKSCLTLFEYLSKVADYVPKWHGEHHCLIMDDENWYRGNHQNNENGKDVNHDERIARIHKFCAKRTPIYYNKQMHDAPLLHFRSHFKDTRLLLHFYAFVHFTNPKVGNYYKRLVRDRVRYTDEIFCAAGKIVKSLLVESSSLDGDAKGAMIPSEDGDVGGDANVGYFAMHIRRGDFQWPKMRISAEEWFENTRSWLVPGQLLYIATDEMNRTWFEPLTKHYQARFLDDYNELVGLSDLDPNYVGMIDQVVASRSKVFVGTYFSSFSAFIGRMRAYHGLSGKKMYYSHPDYWNETHSWVYPHSSYSAREFPLGWVGIDEDDEPSEKDFY